VREKGGVRRREERGGVRGREERGGVRAARGEEKERRELVTVEPWPHGVYLFGVFYLFFSLSHVRAVGLFFRFGAGGSFGFSLGAGCSDWRQILVR